MEQHKKPCSACPFSRACEPGAIGSKADVFVYVGQAAGPFWLPCHQSPGYDLEVGPESAEQNRRRHDEHLQCAGAAAFRANLGVDKLLRPELLKVDKDTEKVFASPEEMIAHHEKVTVEAAVAFLKKIALQTLVSLELQKLSTGKAEFLDPAKTRKT